MPPLGSAVGPKCHTSPADTEVRRRDARRSRAAHQAIRVAQEHRVGAVDTYVVSADGQTLGWAASRFWCPWSTILPPECWRGVRPPAGFFCSAYQGPKNQSNRAMAHWSAITDQEHCKRFVHVAPRDTAVPQDPEQIRLVLGDSRRGCAQIWRRVFTALCGRRSRMSSARAETGWWRKKVPGYRS